MTIRRDDTRETNWLMDGILDNVMKKSMLRDKNSRINEKTGGEKLITL